MTDTSTDQRPNTSEAEMANYEALSAMVDGEASELEVRRVLKALESDEALRERWHRYQLVRAVMKRENANPTVDLSQRISAAIAQEASPAHSENEDAANTTTKASKSATNWFATLGKTAVAASVALALVLGVQQFNQADQTSVQMAEAPQSEPMNGVNSVPQGFELPPFAARTVSTRDAQPAWSVSPHAVETRVMDEQAVQAQFERLLLKHTEQATSVGSMGLLPFARVNRIEASTAPSAGTPNAGQQGAVSE